MDYVPCLPDWVTRRPRLYSRMDAVRHGGIVLVNGSEGAGKTVAVADWAHQADDRGAWITLDASTQTRQGVWRRVIRALDLPDRSTLLAEFESKDPGVFREAIGWALSEQSRVVVIDELDFLDDPEMYEDLNYLSTTVPVGFVLIGRTDRGRDIRAIQPSLSTAELALTPDETLAVVEASGVNASLAEQIQSRVRGWPRGIRAAARALADSPSTQNFEAVIDQAVEHETSDVLERLASLGAEAIRVAQLCSVAGTVTAREVASLLPGADAESILDRLVSAGAGMWMQSDGELHFMLATHVSVLLQRREIVHPEKRVPALVRELARLAEKSGRTIDAARLLRANRNWGEVRELAKRNFHEILVLDRRNWLEFTASLPLVAFQREPVLAVLHSLLVYSDPRSGAAKARATAVSALAYIGTRLTANPHAVDRVWTTVSLLGAQRLAGRYGAAWKTASTLEGLLRALTPAQKKEVQALERVAHLHIATTRFYGGAINQSRDDFAQSANSPVITEWGVLHARSMIALTHAVDGEFAAAEVAIREVIRSPKPRSWYGTYSAAGTHLAEALLAIERGDAGDAEAKVGVLNQHYSTIEHWPLMLWVGGQAALLRGISENAEWELAAEVHHRSQRAPTSEWMNALLIATRVDLLLASGEVAHAVRLLEASRKSEAMPVRIARARVKLFVGEEDAAVAHAARILSQEGLSPRSRLSALIISAVAHSRLGVDERADAHARAAAVIVESHGLTSPLRTIPTQEARRLGLEVPAVVDSGQPVGDPFGGRAPVLRLTEAERTVIRVLVEKSSAAEIAAVLFLSPNTVKSHLRSIYRKLGVRSRAQALATARRRGLV